MNPELQIGTHVTYKLSNSDVEQISRRRTTVASIGERLDRGEWPVGCQAHIGNPVRVGDLVPAIVVAIFGKETCNLQCFLDGCDTLWATSRLRGEDNGQWNW